MTYQFWWMTDTTQHTYSTPEDYFLYNTGSESRFINQNAYYKDSIKYAFEAIKGESAYTSQESLNAFAQNQIPKINSRPFTSALRVLKDFKKNTGTIVLYQTSDRNYMEVPLKLEWEQLQGMDTIAGISCNKATARYGGRQYTAWFTTQIPVSDGPYIFQGLPGLITKVVDSDQIYFFELKSYTIQPKRKVYHYPFIRQDFPMKIDRLTYITRSRKEKEDPVYPAWMPNVTPDQTLQLKEKRKTRFDLIIERQ